MKLILEVSEEAVHQANACVSALSMSSISDLFECMVEEEFLLISTGSSTQEQTEQGQVEQALDRVLNPDVSLPLEVRRPTLVQGDLFLDTTQAKEK